MGRAAGPYIWGGLLPVDPALALHGEVHPDQQEPREGGLDVDRLQVLGPDGEEQDGHHQPVRRDLPARQGVPPD